MLRATIAAIALTLPSVASAESWAIGQEREVDEGTYMTLVAERDRWRVWRVETSYRVSCKAAKTPIGGGATEPAGYGDILTGNEPFIEINEFRGEPSARLRGRHGYGGKWRRPGERFWEDLIALKDLASADGETVEVVIETWRHPNLRIGLVNQEARIDMTGAKWATEQVLACS